MLKKLDLFVNKRQKIAEYLKSGCCETITNKKTIKWKFNQVEKWKTIK